MRPTIREARVWSVALALLGACAPEPVLHDVGDSGALRPDAAGATNAQSDLMRAMSYADITGSPGERSMQPALSDASVPVCPDSLPPSPATQLPGAQTLVQPQAWSTQDPAQDALRSHQPDTVDCANFSFYEERGQLELSTQRCNYFSLEQPSLHSVSAGTPVIFSFYHFDLSAPESSTAHIALLFGNAVQWEQTIAIPQPAQVVSVCFTATQLLAEGEPVTLHLHNHGQNTWVVTDILSLSPGS